MADELEQEVVDEPVLNGVGADEAPVETEEASEPQRPAWLDKLGGEYASLSEEQAIERIQRSREAETRASQLEDQNRQAQFALWQTNQRAAQLEAQARQQAQPQTDGAKKKWQAPEYDPAWLRYVDKDASGKTIVLPGGRPDLLQKISDYAEWQQQQQANFYKDPAAFISDVAGDQIRQMAQEVMSGQWQQMTHQAEEQRQAQAVLEFEHRNAALLYDDPQTKQRPSQIGYECVRRQQQYVQIGVKDRSQALEMALRDMYAEAQSQEYQRLSSAGAPGKTKQEQFLRQTAANAVTKKPNRDGGSAAGILPKGKLSFATMLRNNLAKSGVPSE